MIDFEKMKKFRNEQKAFIKYIGFQILDIKEDYAQGEVVLREIHGNPIGSVHGGVLFSIADTIGGVAASSSAGSMCTTVNGNINYMNPALGCKKLIGTAHTVKAGHNLAVVHVDITDENDRLLACAQMTYHYLWDKVPFPYNIEEEEKKEDRS